MSREPLGDVISVPTIWVNKIRSFMRDNPDVNELIEGVEHSDDQIAEAIVDAADEFNMLTPNGAPLDINMSSLHTINRTLRRMIFKLSICNLLESVSIAMQRNEVSTPSGNIVENLNDKWRNYDGTIRRLKYGDGGIEGAIPALQNYKRMLSCDFANSSIHSELYYPYTGMKSFIQVGY
jgi:hypothetical protein